MVYLKEFQDVSAYYTYATSEEFIEPNVSMIGEYGEPGFIVLYNSDKPRYQTGIEITYPGTMMDNQAFTISIVLNAQNPTENVSVLIDDSPYLVDNYQVQIASHGLHSGTHTIVVSYPGDDNNEPTSVTENFWVSASDR